MRRVYLDNVVERNREFPDFRIPDETKRATLVVGDFVKVIFRSELHSRTEGMWLEVTIADNGRYVGRLDNNPVVFRHLKDGAMFDFGPDNIADILQKGKLFTEIERLPSKRN